LYQTPNRQIALERRSAEVLVNLVEAAEHRLKIFPSDRQHGRKSDSRIHRVAAANPVPELEHVGCIDAELRHLRRISRDCDEVLGNRRLVSTQASERPITRSVGIGHRLQRRESLRRDDKQRLRRIESINRFYEIGAIDIRYKMKCHVALAVVL
jgi:hypothetical protein